MFRYYVGDPFDRLPFFDSGQGDSPRGAHQL